MVDDFGATTGSLFFPPRVTIAFADTSEMRWGGLAAELPDVCEADFAPLREALESAGATVDARRIGFANLDQLTRLDTDFVFNLVDGIGLDGVPGTEVPLSLAAAGIPFSGFSARPYHDTSDKFAMRELLRRVGVPVPPGFTLVHPDVRLPEGVPYPVIVKPRFGYASLSVDEHSVVANEASLRTAVERVCTESGGDALVERYIAGREVTIGVIGGDGHARTLPILELIFDPQLGDRPQIRTQQSKHLESCYDDVRTQCPAPLDDELARRLRGVALAAYRAVGGDGYGRVDLRIDTAGEAWVCEVNANPSLEWGQADRDCAMLPLIAKAGGWSYPLLIRQLVEIGMHRPPPPPPPPVIMIWRRDGFDVRTTRPFRAGEQIVRIPRMRPGPPGLAGAWPWRGDRTLYPSPPARFVDCSSRPNTVAGWNSQRRYGLFAAVDLPAGARLNVDPDQAVSAWRSHPAVRPFQPRIQPRLAS